MRIIGWMPIALLSSLAGLTGCMVGPDFHSPHLSYPTSYTDSPLTKKTINTPSVKNGGQSQYLVTAKTIPADWWVLFHSSELNQLIQTGLANSPNLAAATAALHQAQETWNSQVGALLYPAVVAQLTAARSRTANSAGFGTSANTFSLYNASVNVSYLLDIFGASRRELEALQAQVDYQRFELAAARLSLTANIVTTAIAAAAYAEQIQATKQLIQLQEQQLEITDKQFNLGGVSGADVLSQEAQVAEVKATLPPLEKSLAQSRHALAVLIGLFPNKNDFPNLNLNQLHLPTYLPVSLPSDLVRQRPDIQASEALLHVASAQVGVATANLFPQITLSAAAGWQAFVPAPHQLLQNNNSVWSIGGSLLQPIFNGRSLQAAQSAALAAYDQAEAQYYQTVLLAFQNVADTLQAIQHDAQLLHAEKAAEMASYHSMQLLQQQYKLGGVSYMNLLIAQKQYQQAVIQRIQAQAARYSDTAALFQSLGGVWWSTDKDTQHG